MFTKPSAAGASRAKRQGEIPALRALEARQRELFFPVYNAREGAEAMAAPLHDFIITYTLTTPDPDSIPQYARGPGTDHRYEFYPGCTEGIPVTRERETEIMQKYTVVLVQNRPYTIRAPHGRERWIDPPDTVQVEAFQTQDSAISGYSEKALLDGWCWGIAAKWREGFRFALPTDNFGYLWMKKVVGAPGPKRGRGANKRDVVASILRRIAEVLEKEIPDD